jgi:hypothetical protein
LFKFLFEVDSVEGTILEQRIIEICGKGSLDKGKLTYDLKAGAGKLFRQLSMYDDSLTQEIKANAKDNFYFFDYVKHHEAEKVTGTQQFTYEEETFDDREKLGGYKLHNTRIGEIKEPVSIAINGADCIEPDYKVVIQLGKIALDGEHHFGIKV